VCLLYLQGEVVIFVDHCKQVEGTSMKERIMVRVLHKFLTS
jgi:hypothetical protein